MAPFAAEPFENRQQASAPTTLTPSRHAEAEFDSGVLRVDRVVSPADDERWLDPRGVAHGLRQVGTAHHEEQREQAGQRLPALFEDHRAAAHDGEAGVLCAFQCAGQLCRRVLGEDWGGIGGSGGESIRSVGTWNGHESKCASRSEAA